MSVAEIQNAISDLPQIERGRLAAWLLDSLPPHDSEEADSTNIEEAARRRVQLDSGQVRELSSDEFWASVERLRTTWR